MPKFRKKPVVIEAFQITLETRQDNKDWPNWLHSAWNKEPGSVGAFWPSGLGNEQQLFVQTLEGLLTVSFNDWIIRGTKGELYPCKPDVFEEIYEAVE